MVGVLEPVSVAKVTIVNADHVAEEHGLPVDEDRGMAREPYANLVVVHVRSEGGETNVAATYTPQGVRIVGIDDYEVEIAPGVAPFVLAIENVDRPGMIGRIGSLLGEWGVNVSSMSSVPGSVEGRALMALGISRALTAEERAEIAATEDIFTARLIDLT